ncbi:hypothetical protein C9374_001603 [Naegleria lovaniensis]|uniref:Uncharacterized protein n=1 Tax=Naegleria lovaniensis TaxID=51637 RepID=A0AA88GRV9_NAELO|nr:uncharacterized protein C9374_001603 [Naegleria lovaniensis]KAG2387271.1 hypothetical protein C9374_001603 [Naegleria lovaniensis]
MSSSSQVTTYQDHNNKRTAQENQDLMDLVKKTNTKEETKLQKLHKAAGASDVSKCPYHRTMNFVKGAFGMGPKKTKEEETDPNKKKEEKKEEEEKGWCLVM